MLKYLLFLLPIIGFAQDAVHVEYEVKQVIDRSTIKKSSAKIEEMIINSESKRFYFELFVNKNQSNFERIERINNEQNGSGIAFGLSSDIGANIYKDFNSRELYENNAMKPKLFIKDSIQTFPWVLSKDEATILGYKVRKATYTNPTQTVEAWYAPDLPFRDCPSRFNGLPGLILQIKFASRMFSIVNFTAIDIKPYTGKIEIPNKSKKITKEEYDKEIEKSMGKSGGMIYQGVEKD